MTLLKDVRRVTRPLLDFFLPPHCQLCHEDILEPQSLCGPCWSKLSFITEPCCYFCGTPFDYFVEEGSRCAACIQHKPAFARMRAALLYEDTSRSLLMRLKHGDATYLSPMLARWMATCGKELLAETDVMVPVPLHWTRLIKRRYNQAALLTRELFFETKVAWHPGILRRTRRTPSQGHLSKVRRLANVAGAFEVVARDKALISGKTILLIDDVYTTGATVNACARALLKAGAARVNVLVLSRTRTFS